MRALLVAALALVAPASALVAHPMMRSAPMGRAAVSMAPAMSRTADPQMLFGGASRSFGRALRSVSPRFPTFGKGGVSRGGNGGRMDGGDGGDGTDGKEATPSPDDDDSDDNPLKKAWKRYEELLDEKPVLMKALTSMTGFALGDILAQKFIQKTDPFDFLRLLRLTSFGFFVHGVSSPPSSTLCPAPPGISSAAAMCAPLRVAQEDLIGKHTNTEPTRLLGRPPRTGSMVCLMVRSRAHLPRLSSPRSSSIRLGPWHTLSGNGWSQCWRGVTRWAATGAVDVDGGVTPFSSREPCVAYVLEG